MKFLAKYLVLPAAFIFGSATLAAPAQAPPSGGFTDADGLRIAREVQKRLLSLNQYGVFDSLHFGLRGGVITLGGYASRPGLKSSAEKAIKDIQGVKEVDNNIEVLPTSQNDDQIRAAVYARIYGTPALRKYSANSPMQMNDSLVSRTGGISLNPPIGYHAIHIIVKNGNVILVGAVDSESDSAIAHMQANSTPGVFSVDNNLVVASRPSGSKRESLKR